MASGKLQINSLYLLKVGTISSYFSVTLLFSPPHPSPCQTSIIWAKVGGSILDIIWMHSDVGILTAGHLNTRLATYDVLFALTVPLQAIVCSIFSFLKTHALTTGSAGCCDSHQIQLLYSQCIIAGNPERVLTGILFHHWIHYFYIVLHIFHSLSNLTWLHTHWEISKECFCSDKSLQEKGLVNQVDQWVKIFILYFSHSAPLRTLYPWWSVLGALCHFQILITSRRPCRLRPTLHTGISQSFGLIMKTLKIGPDQSKILEYNEDSGLQYLQEMVFKMKKSLQNSIEKKKGRSSGR